MSNTDNQAYFTVPLSILRCGKSELEALDAAVSVGIVNAGYGFADGRDQSEIHERVEDALEWASAKGAREFMPGEVSLYRKGKMIKMAEAFSLMTRAVIGAHMMKANGGSRREDAQMWLDHQQQGEVFFRIKDNWLWTALTTARRKAGQKVEIEREISWREIRILAALLSAKPNKLGFTFMGWEVIQARACGFHSKALFADGQAKLPPHCQPLSRKQIRTDIDRLEALGFFARVRYAAGERGGLTAFSFRQSRTDLFTSIKSWSASNSSFQATRKANRAEDLKAFTKGPTEGQPRANIKKLLEEEGQP
jgi:hypothetical protein